MADPKPWNPNYGVVGSGDRRLAYSRQLSISSPLAPTPRLARSDSSISMPSTLLQGGPASIRSRWLATRHMRRLALLLALNVAYSAVEFSIGLLTGRIGLVSDAFHLTFGCGLLTFSLFAMAASRTKPDSIYTYGYKRLEVLAAFTNAVSFATCPSSLNNLLVQANRAAIPSRNAVPNPTFMFYQHNYPLVLDALNCFLHSMQIPYTP